MTSNPAGLRSAAAALISAAEMLEHNDAIFKGKWKKGSKAWSGDFIERTVADGLALLTPVSETATINAAGAETPTEYCAVGPAERSVGAAPLLADKRRPGEQPSLAMRLAMLAASMETSIHDTGIAAFIDGTPPMQTQIAWIREAVSALEAPVAPSAGVACKCGLKNADECVSTPAYCDHPSVAQSATLATWPRHVLEAVHSALDKQLGDSDIGHLVNDEDILNHQPVQWAATEISKMLATVGPTATEQK